MQQLLLVTFIDWIKLNFCDALMNGQMNKQTDQQTDMLIEIVM